MVAAREWDEGPRMTSVGLLSTSAFLLACGVHPDDLGEAWALARSVKHNAEYVSQMGPLAHVVTQYAEERAIERAREAKGLAGRHTGAVFTLS